MTVVRCTVNSCVFWDQGNRCGADEILVVNTRALQRDDDSMEIADMGYTPASMSVQTACKTFRPRKEGDS